MERVIDLGDLIIPLIKPQKGVDYYTASEKQELVNIVTNNVNEVVLPQEEIRQGNEVIRQDNEATRQSQEDTRQSNETSRQTAETARASAESTRQSNETSRVSAEQTREQTFNTKMEAVDTAIAGINTSQESFNTNATAKTTAFNENAASKTSDFNTNATNKTNAFDEHTEEIQTKLATIETGAEVNIIETVKVNGTALTPTDKEVDVPVPTKTSDLNNDSNFGTYSKPSGGIPKTDLASDVQTSLGKADSALQEHQDISGKEDKSNKVTELTDESTDTEYPSAKAVYDELESVKAENEVLKSEVENQQKILSQMPKVIGEGTEFTMENTIEAQFAEFLPGGNTVQDGEPTVDNPVERYSAGANGSITEKIINKNFHNKTTDESGKRLAADGTLINDSGYATTDYIPVIPSSNIVYSRAENGGGSAAIVFYTKDKVGISRTMPIMATTALSKTITIPENAHYIKTCDSTTIMDKIQIEFGSTATPYTEHKEQTYTIPVQQEMRSIGTVRDDFVETENGWFERHKINRKALKDLQYNFTATATGNLFTAIGTQVEDFKKIVQTVKSNIFLGIESSTGRQNNNIYYNQPNDRLDIICNEYDNATDFKAMLEEKNGYIDYILATPTLLPCTQEQIDVLENLPETYAEQTNVLSEDTVPANVKASGYLDLNTLVARVAQLETEV